MSKATRRSLHFDDLDEVVAEVQRLHENGYTKLGNWSLGQCCNHLAQAMNLTVDRYSFRFPPPISAINRALFFKTSWVPPLLGKLSLPTLPGFAQTEPVDDTEGMNRLIDSVGRVQAASDADLQPNPLMGRLTKDQWERFHAFHAQRHLGFLVSNDQSPNQSQQTDETENKSAAVHS
jgi:hypothetical protein